MEGWSAGCSGKEDGMAKKSDVHIVKQKGGSGWDVKQGGDVKSSHRTQGKAVQKGTSIAKDEKVDVVTHGRDGRIRSKDSYGNETAKKDTEH
jgi:hypothetical protein